MAKRKISDEAWEKLRKEHAYLDAARTMHRSGDLQEAFSNATATTDTIGVIRQYVAMLDRGLTPPPHILSAVYEGFASYLASQGNQSLDYAFGLLSKPSVGHPLDHRSMQERRGREVCYMLSLRYKARAEGKRLSIHKAAGITIEELRLSVSESALEKSYKEFNVEQIFEKAAEIVKEMNKKASKTRK